MTDSVGGSFLSKVPDGGVIRMLYGNGEDYFAVCHYLDETHAEIRRREIRRSGSLQEDGTETNQLCPCLKDKGIWT